MASAVGNYLRRDSNTASEYRAFATRNAVTGSQLYLNDNVLDNGPVPPGFTEFAVIANEGIDPRVSSPPVAVPGYSPLSGSATYAHVLANAGARPRDRDAVDLRIIKEVGDRTGSVCLASQSSGWLSFPCGQSKDADIAVKSAHRNRVGLYELRVVVTRSRSSRGDGRGGHFHLRPCPPGQRPDCSELSLLIGGRSIES